MGASVERVRRAYQRLAEVDRPEVWISVRDLADAEREAGLVDARAAAGEALPLHGVVLAVKDNIDVAGLATTGAFPSAVPPADADATAVARLRAAGAVVIGKTNLDQFATGLVGTRSPYGAVRNARHPERISGGSSSGSAVAVALGVVDIALGTDTAGSGRVPAALNGIVGVKPTLGLVPAAGMMPACHPYDTITVFARDLPAAVRAARTMTGPDAADPLSRAWPADVRLAGAPRPVLGVPADDDLASLEPFARAAWRDATDRLAEHADLRPVAIAPLLAAAKLLYEGAIVAGRFHAAGERVTRASGDAATGLDPTVAGIVRGARDVAGWEYVRDRAELDRAAVRARELLAGCECLVVPTAPAHPTIAAVRADPVALNARMGTFTNFVNLLDMSAVSVPAASTDDGEFGVTFIADAFDDQLAVDAAARFLGVPAEPWADAWPRLAVFGAHLRGQPLNGELVALGARFVQDVVTADAYRLYALDTAPPKPGLVRVGAGGSAIAGELWAISPSALGTFLGALPPPMTLGPVTLSTGETVVGFGCEPGALDGARDITHVGGWRRHREGAR
ncbi:allophanate hydrolase [Streptomyces radicis]|uniref:Allophanate hydrolase n=1 Tax=Streptomyces radicis TaxID=1750517 RepID=A0A3A9WKQ8_9ACTN|nr:allophanate hydrolase [Streptomyces radicis]RKN12883.1 allophanate hydrolase [Streptomyces radicis]RKN27352.1 allophanate hydrolase [Streptomyces radicis]